MNALESISALDVVQSWRAGESGRFAKHADNLERYAHVRQRPAEIREMLEQIRGWLPQPAANERPQLR